ncbi:MAG TPA: hypothetical protein VNE38_13900 [Ktedonobacteraceae bacterium]|nr:hypothetical protein [Ktedonobacteraceae bacterium]
MAMKLILISSPIAVYMRLDVTREHNRRGDRRGRRRYARTATGRHPLHDVIQCLHRIAVVVAEEERVWRRLSPGKFSLASP